jgi:hydrogenase expression/formation protein HypE
MKVGKVSNDVLNRIVLGKIKNLRQEVLLRPRIGEDCCAVDFGNDACVLTSDPITGAVNQIGRLAVHISCNDIASSGAEPVGLLAAILVPAGTTEAELSELMEQMSAAAAALKIDIIGGHTEVTSAVTRCVVVTTVIGRVVKEKLVVTSGAKPGDSIVMTKWAGLEGTSIIAHDRETELSRIMDSELLYTAKELMEYISVVKEGRIASEFGVSSMHDATEGGVLGALWEIAEASEAGMEIDSRKIPIRPETLEVCRHFGLNPLKLISSGCMLICCRDGETLVGKLKENGITAAVIGRITEDRARILRDGDRESPIGEPESDELYKVVG